jgi:hypothetical protein
MLATNDSDDCYAWVSTNVVVKVGSQVTYSQLRCKGVFMLLTISLYENVSKDPGGAEANASGLCREQAASRPDFIYF